MEGSKAVINSTITPNMTFTQTSQKFGQWSDVRANTVYGLGFSSELELSKFVEKFQEVKDATKKAIKASAGNTGTAAGAAAQTANANDSYMNSSATAAVPPPISSTPLASANTSPISGRNSLLAPVDMSHESLVAMEQQQPLGASGAMMGPTAGMAVPSLSTQDATSPSHKFKAGAAANAPALSALGNAGGMPAMPTDASGQQLKYENERLKLALAQSSANAKNWEIELQTLRNNNMRLTSALQESTANVDEWKRQLQTYKEENVKMKSQVHDLMDANGDQQQLEVTGDLRKEVALLHERIESLEGELKAQELELKAATNKSLRDRTADPSMKQMSTLVGQFAKHLAEMSQVQKEMEKIMISSKST